MRNQIVNMLSTEFQPRNEYILVRAAEFQKESKTSTGLVIDIKQDSVINRPTSGTVIAVGDSVQGIEIGDFIVWPETDGIDLMFDNGEFMLIREKSVIGQRSNER